MTRSARAAALALALAAALAGCGGAAAPSGATVNVTATEYKFGPAEIDVPAGKVTFKVTNTGTTEHEFEIVQNDATVGEVEGLVPGLTGTLTLDLKPGTYTFQCLLAAHNTLGMTGTLTVH
jgi:iron uptake system component EfeO